MVQTRSASSSPVKRQTMTISAKTTSTQPSRPTTEPLRLVIAPQNTSANSRFLTLSEPESARPRRFLFCRETGVHELRKIEVPKHDPRSILLAPSNSTTTSAPQKVDVSSGYVNKNADYMTATPYDISFTLLPLVLASGRSSLFQSMDDLIDTADVETYDLRYVLQHNRKLVEDALESICDTVEAGDEKMFRYSQTKTLHNIISKARRVVDIRLPASLEDRFVTRALEAPVLSVRREESTISLSNTEPEPQDSASRTSTPTPYESFDSQSSAASVAPSVVFSEASVATTTTLTATVPEPTIPATIKHLQRLLTAFKFITASYLSSSLSSTLLALLQDPTVSGIDFAPLNEHLDHIAKLRAQATASSDLASFSRKRGGLEEDEEAELRAEKKRRLEEEEKRKKASTSHGVKQLAKVDVKGMKKMSAFFTPKVKAKG